MTLFRGGVTVALMLLAAFLRAGSWISQGRWLAGDWALAHGGFEESWRSGRCSERVTVFQRRVTLSSPRVTVLGGELTLCCCRVTVVADRGATSRQVAGPI